MVDLYCVFVVPAETADSKRVKEWPVRTEQHVQTNLFAVTRHWEIILQEHLEMPTSFLPSPIVIALFVGQIQVKIMVLQNSEVISEHRALRNFVPHS